MKRAAALLCSLTLACGGSAPPAWAGRWFTTNTRPGSGVSMTLEGNGTAVGGSGVQHREAGMDAPFTIGGSIGPPAGLVSFTFEGGTSEGFHYSQPDQDHLVLANPQRSLAFARGP